MVLYALCLHPLLRTLEEKLPGITTGPRKRSASVIAYADDVTVFVTQPKDFETIRHAISCYEKAKGAQFNAQKSKALAIGTWAQPTTPLRVAFHDHVKIIGITFGSTMTKSVSACWTAAIRKIRVQTSNAYTRTLYLAQRIQYVHLSLLVKIWCVAQVPPLRDLMCNNSQQCVRATFGRGRPSVYLWLPYKDRKNKADGQCLM
jgi:hypothetical protein